MLYGSLSIRADIKLVQKLFIILVEIDVTMDVIFWLNICRVKVMF